MIMDTDFDQAIAAVLKEYERQYEHTPPELRTGAFSESEALRAARLAGVLIKRDFCNEIELDEVSTTTGARFAYDLKVEKIQVNGEQHQAFIDSWQAQLYTTLDPYWGPVEAAINADSERETVKRVARAARWLVCGRQKHLNEIMATGVLPTGSVIAAETAAVKATATWLAANVPVLAFVSPAVLVAFTVFLIGFGLNRFCSSEKLAVLFQNADDVE